MKETDIRPEEEVLDSEDIDAEIDTAATMTCLTVAASCLALVSVITKAGNPAGTSLMQILLEWFSYLGVPAFAFMAARNALNYIRLLHDRSRSAGNHCGE